MQHIRNFSIIAHVDHGKSTLADRLIQLCGGLSSREMQEQVLDSMDLERERGITIKAQSVTLHYETAERKYLLNIIDTPGHVDFSYEVSRSLAACEGALLLVDAAQGVEAQSMATCLSAMEYDLKVLPVLNKIDLPAAEPQRVANEIENLLGLSTERLLQVSAKYGTGIEQLLERIIECVPPPPGNAQDPLRALIIDSWFDNYSGVISLVRMIDGRLALKDRVRVMSTGQDYLVTGLGVFTPRRTPRDFLETGEVGYVIAGVKQIDGAPVGDTLSLAQRPAQRPLPGFKKINPRVFAGLFPVDSGRYRTLRDALARLRLNDAALHLEPESSQALGFGFRCGFLGLLHMEIVQERLEREYDLELIATTPTVVYRVKMKSDEVLAIDNPAQLPERSRIAEILEPVVELNILSPQEYLGAIISLCINRRGRQREIRYADRQAMLRFDLPLSSIVLDFFDRLKSISRGRASCDYDNQRFEAADLVKMDLWINGKPVDALSSIVHRNSAQERGRALAVRMKELIPRQMFEVAIQAVIGSRVIARESVKALRKNVTAKCYGGDVSRKRKLLEKQKEGKKRMKQIGMVQIPQEAFMAVLRVGGRSG